MHLAGIKFSYSAGLVPFRDTCIQQIIRIHIPVDGNFEGVTTAI